jgi:hypothetical protein
MAMTMTISITITMQQRQDTNSTRRPTNEESSLTSLGLPKREASDAVRAMSITVIVATFFILISVLDFAGLKICEMRDAPSILNCDPTLFGEAICALSKELNVSFRHKSYLLKAIILIESPPNRTEPRDSDYRSRLKPFK